jgi:hypothetical protein
MSLTEELASCGGVLGGLFLDPWTRCCCSSDSEYDGYVAGKHQSLCAFVYERAKATCGTALGNDANDMATSWAQPHRPLSKGIAWNILLRWNHRYLHRSSHVNLICETLQRTLTSTKSARKDPHTTYTIHRNYAISLVIVRNHIKQILHQTIQLIRRRLQLIRILSNPLRRHLQLLAFPTCQVQHI